MLSKTQRQLLPYLFENMIPLKERYTENVKKKIRRIKKIS
jgi:hypothetical protein